MTQPVLELREISKAFPGVQALESVSLDVLPGEVHVLAGENGAGKSTIMKVMMGIHKPDSGEILLDGKKVNIHRPDVAASLGIRMIFQELNLIPELSVASNIFLGSETYKNKLLRTVDRAAMERDAKAILDQLNVSIDPGMRVKDLGAGRQQIVEIAKALSKDARIVVFDEPTSSLMDSEIKELFALIQRLREKGIAMFYISHRLEELFEIGDRVSILRDGRLIDTKPIAELTMDELISKIANRTVDNLYPHTKHPAGDTVLRVSNLCNKNCRDISIEIKAGEIVGVAGLVGAGRTELARAIFGIDNYESGAVELMGQPVPRHNTTKSVAMGISLLPEDRKSEGLALSLPIKENIIISSLKKLFPKVFTSEKVKQDVANAHVKALGIATSSVKKNAKKLSGGTQQKVVVAKWLTTDARLFIFDEPTRGIDVGAKASIYEIMDNLVAQGAAILMISSDLSEVLGMSDRLYVMARGKIAAELDAKETNQTQVLTYAFEQAGGAAS